ncbi:MAG: arrestin family protein [Verrucomicrobia bacterium]|jgi:hypothetical protein|nr:arrestin family protein [Verrucomicrobiota bacterium]
MKLRLLFWLVPWLVWPSLWGQVTVSVMLEQRQFLPGEAVPLKVRLVNHSGQSLTFGEDEDWLRLTVQATDSFVVSRQGEVPVRGPFVLPPSKMATKDLDLAPYFVLSRSGRYTVTATVLIKEWGQSLTSEPESFDLVTGTRLWEKEFGLPRSKAGDGPPEVRKYLLQQANYVSSQIRLYARITDLSEERTFRVVPIGPMVSFSRPTAVVDPDSNLHVLYQSGPRVSTYCALSPDGEVLIHEKREYSGSRPRLSAAENGTITVIGGMRVGPPEPPAASEEPQKHQGGPE